MLENLERSLEKHPRHAIVGCCGRTLGCGERIRLCGYRKTRRHHIFERGKGRDGLLAVKSRFSRGEIPSERAIDRPSALAGRCWNLTQGDALAGMRRALALVESFKNDYFFSNL